MKYILFSLAALIFSFTASSQDTIAVTSTKQDVGLRASASITEAFFDTIPKDGKIVAMDFINDLWLVKYKEVEGYIFSDAIYKTRAMYDLLNNSKKDNFIAEYGEEIGDKIFRKHIWIGMAKSMLLDSRGYPEDKNITTGEWGVHEQWVYRTKYVYVENGVVTALQD